MKEKTNKLFIGGLSYDTTDESLRTLIEFHGYIKTFRIVRDRVTGKSKGYAFVTMYSADDAEKCVNLLNNSELDGYKIGVQYASKR